MVGMSKVTAPVVGASSDCGSEPNALAMLAAPIARESLVAAGAGTAHHCAARWPRDWRHSSTATASASSAESQARP